MVNGDGKNESLSSQALYSSWWFPLWEFLTHVVVGTCIFVIIGMPAVGLDILVRWLSGQGINNIVIYGLKIGEYTLFFIGLGLFVIFLVRTAWQTYKKL